MSHGAWLCRAPRKVIARDLSPRSPPLRPRMRSLLFITVAALVGVVALGSAPTVSEAHRDGCHRWHTCPSDTGSYECGDLGYACEYESVQTPAPRKEPRSGCARPDGVQSISFSGTKYPRILAHFRAAVRRGWPRTLVVNRSGADARRDRLLGGFPTRNGFDRDEYPPAVGRGRGNDLVRGSGPRGWKADVAYVPSSENRSHGSTLGIKLRRFCDGTRFRYVFY